MEFALQETAYFFEASSSAIRGGLRKVGQHLADHFIPHARNNYHPHILGHRTLALFSLLLVAVKVAVIASVIFETPEVTQASAITVDNVISLTNQSRTDNNLKTLKQNAQLSSAAQAKANDMLARQYFSHNTPTGETPWSFIKTAGYQYIEAGENLAVDFTDADAVESAWMNSPGHRANILNKDFEEIGIGISEGQFEGHHSIFVIQMFGTPAEQAVTMQDKPTTVEKPAVASASTPAQVAKPAPAPAPTPTPSVAVAEPTPAPDAITPAPQDLKILDATATPSTDSVIITVHTSSSATKVIAEFNGVAIMLDPKADDVWSGSIPLSRVAGSETSIVVRAFDIKGSTAQQQLASFSSGLKQNFSSNSLFNTSRAASVNYFGANININDFQTKFFLIFVAGVLTALALAIGIKRHVQHLPLISNSAFVVLLAVGLWMAG